MVMFDLYENEYGIYPHLSAGHRRPLASVAMHPCESVMDDSLLEEVARTFLEKNIGDKFKLNIIEFLSLPMDYVELLIRLSDEKAGKVAGELASIERQFKT